MLQLLLKFWFFPLFMMFASGAGIADLGTNGGDTGGGDNGDGGADDGSDGSSDDGDGSADDGADDSASADLNADADDADSQNDDADPNAPVDLGDGRQVPGKFKKLFDLAKKAGLEKEAKQLYFAQQRLAKAIPGGINAAIELAKNVDELGGIEGVQQLQDEIGTYKQDEELFSAGDPKWVEAGFQENPESSLRLFAHSLDYVAENHPDHYNHYMAKVIVNDLAHLDVRGMYAKLSAMKDDPEAKALAKTLAEYYNTRLETSKNVPEKKVDAQSKALTDRESKVKKGEMDLRYKQVNTAVFPALKSDVTRVLQAEAKASGIDIAKLSKDYPAEWRNMLNEIHQKVMKQAIKDSRFIAKYAALVEKGELERAERAINEKHKAIIPEIVRAVKQSYGVFRGKKAANAAADKGGAGDKGGNSSAAAAQGQGFTRVRQAPERSLVDWNKTTTQMQLDGKYILRDGKKVVVAY